MLCSLLGGGGDGGLVLAREGLQQFLLLGGDALLAAFARLLHAVASRLRLVAAQHINTSYFNKCIQLASYTSPMMPAGLACAR